MKVDYLFELPTEYSQASLTHISLSHHGLYHPHLFLIMLAKNFRWSFQISSKGQEPGNLRFSKIIHSMQIPNHHRTVYINLVNIFSTLSWLNKGSQCALFGNAIVDFMV